MFKLKDQVPCWYYKFKDCWLAISWTIINWGTIHKRRRQFFWIFDTPSPLSVVSLVLSVGNFDQFLTQPPLSIVDVISPRVNQHQWRNDLSFLDESIKSVFSSKDVDRYEVVPLLLSYQMPYIIDARRPSFFRQAFQSVRSKEQIRWRHLLDIQLYDKWNGRKDTLGNFRQYANQFDRR